MDLALDVRIRKWVRECARVDYDMRSYPVQYEVCDRRSVSVETAKSSWTERQAILTFLRVGHELVGNESDLPTHSPSLPPVSEQCRFFTRVYGDILKGNSRELLFFL